MKIPALRSALSRENRLIVAMAGGLLALAFIRGYLLPDGEPVDQTLPVAAASTTTEPATTTTVSRLAGVDPLNCGDLLTIEEVDEALGLLDLPVAERRWVQFEQGEVCIYPLLDNDSVFVRIEPGAPVDFEPGAQLLGVAGEQVGAVGDDARWFGGVSADDDGTTGTLSVYQGTSLGALHFRITLGRPDLSSTEQLEAAKTAALAALPRFPGVEPEPVIVTLERDPVDRSHVSFVDNLLAKEEAGEWTRSEGLVATLRFFAGELGDAGVLRHEQLLTYEGTGIYTMAYDYLANGPDEGAREEIARLLDRLVFSHEQLQGMAGVGEVTAMMGTVAPGTTAAAEEDCTRFFSGYELPVGVGKCLEDKLCFDPYLEDFHTGEYGVFFPSPPLPTAGWNDHHVTVTCTALADSVQTFDGLGEMPPISIVLSVADDPTAGAVAAPRFGPGVDAPDRPCGIALFPVLQTLGTADFKQFVAHEVAHCFQGENFKDQVRPDGAVTEWREEGLAEYLSNVVYPGNDLESREFLVPFAAQELATTVVDRAYENFIFFQHLYWEIGNEGIIELIRTLPTSGGKSDQAERLAGYGGMTELYHEFAKDVTDEAVDDTKTGPMRHEVQADMIPLSGSIVVLGDPLRFGVVRFHLTVDPSKTACIEYDQTGELRASWREGKPGSPGGSWSENLPDSLQGDAVFVVTSTEEGSTFTLEVTDVSEDPECEEEDSGDQAEAPPCPQECLPSLFYWLFGD